LNGTARPRLSDVITVPEYISHALREWEQVMDIGYNLVSQYKMLILNDSIETND